MGSLRANKTKLLARELLFCIIDLNRTVLSPFFDPKRDYRILLKEYDKFRLEDKQRFYNDLYRLQHAGFIKKYIEGKDTYICLSPKGKNYIKNHILDTLHIEHPNTWDRKWHIIIFDIPNRKKKVRDYIRNTLENLGFIKLQESVYVFPFECSEIINFIKRNYFISSYIQYIIADRIETETDLINKFLNKGVLDGKMII